MATRVVSILRLVFLLSVSVVYASAHAAEPTPETPSPAADIGARLDPTLKSALTDDFLETKIKETEAASDLDEAAKTKLTEQYRKALSDLQATNALEAKAAAYEQALETAPARTQAIRTELTAEDKSAPIALEELSAATAAEMEQRLAKARADSAAVGAKLAEIEKELEASTTRPAEIHQAIGEAERDLGALETKIELPPSDGEFHALADARRWALEARRQALRAKILVLDQELLSHGTRIKLLKAMRDKAANDLEHLESTETQLEGALNKRLKENAAKAASEAQEAQRQAAGKHALVQALAQRNTDLSDELTRLTEELNRASGVQGQIEEQTERIKAHLRNARRRIEAAGLTQALGQVLIDQRNQLPSLRGYRATAAERDEALAQVTLRQIRHSEERRRLRDLDGYVDDLIGSELTDARRADITAELRGLAEGRTLLLEQTLHTDDAYLRMLEDLDHASSRLMAIAQDYDDFLSERLLWVRSTTPVDQATFSALSVAVPWVISPTNWLEVVRVLGFEATHSPLLWLLLLAVLSLEWKARAMRRRIRATAESLRRIRTDRIGHTTGALGLTLLVAAPVPLLLATLGWQLYGSLEATDFTKAIGQAALAVSLGIYYLRAFRVLCMPGGVADRHFRWNGDVLVLLRRSFDWLLVVLAPLGFVAAAAYSHPDASYSSSLGRLTLIAVMAGLAVFFGRVLNPKRGALHNLLAEHPEGWLNRLRRVWYPTAVAIPLVLAVLTTVGYLYTAGILLRSLVGSMYLVLGITVAHQLIVRWLVLTHRRLALDAALARHAARTEERADGTEKSDDTAAGSEDMQGVDFASLDEQTRRLTNMLLFIVAAAGLWAIWSPVLPAFGIFEDIALWHHTGISNGEERLFPITLADIGLVLMITLIATVAAKNLPGLLEILLLSRMSLSPGSRYTVETLTGYIILAIAALTVFNTLGLSWGQVQWLVAALGVGIGFGLQEIVANFISGIIILFERPIRVGDVVTMGDTTGVVSKIRIRATTIRNWDKQELLVPNKEFITGRLLNWTLSDTMNRIVINLGVDYSADVPLAMRLLEEAVREETEVLEDPAPLFSFEGFGDNALNLVVRCYLASLDNRLDVTTTLHATILEKFRSNGVSIAYPQRDVHLSASQPLDVRVHDPERSRN